MTDVGSIVPDTATVPVAHDLVYPQQQQNGHAPAHIQLGAVDDSVSSRRSAGTELPSNNLLNGKDRSDSDDLEAGIAHEKVADPHSNGQAADPNKTPKTGVFNTIMDTKPMKGPRSGIHWGAGMQHALTPDLCCCHHAACQA